MNKRGRKAGRATFHKKHTRKNMSGPMAHSPSQPSSVQCPECTSQKIWKDGLRYVKGKAIQRYLCRSCGYRFSESNVEVNVSAQSLESLNPRSNLPNVGIIRGEFPVKKRIDSLSFQRGKDIAAHRVTVAAKTINTLRDYNSDCRVCVTEDGAKNLAKVVTRQKRAAGATKKAKDIKGKIVEFSFWMLKQGYRESTIRMRTRQMKILVKRGANIFNPESVKEVIATQPWKESRKAIVVNTYTCFLSMIGQTWDPPRYEAPRKIPFIPMEEEIDQLIAGCGKKTAAFLQLLKETAVRAGEAHNLEWMDIDVNRRTIKITPEKRSEPRIFKVSHKLIAMLNALPKGSKMVFGDATYTSRRTTFIASRRKIAEKLQNPRILEIHFHTLRHWKATTLYHQTKDILYVMKFLGHRSIRSTLLYIQLADAIFKGTSDEFTCKVAKTPKEVSELIETGFDYVTEMDGLKFFRKRK